MTEKLSLILATTILAVGGLGLYMYKNSDEMDDYNEDDYDDDDLSDDTVSQDDDVSQDNISEDDFVEEEDVYDKPKSRSKGKTKRAKKNGGTKRKY